MQHKAQLHSHLACHDVWLQTPVTSCCAYCAAYRKWLATACIYALICLLPCYEIGWPALGARGSVSSQRGDCAFSVTRSYLTLAHDVLTGSACTCPASRYLRPSIEFEPD